MMKRFSKGHPQVGLQIKASFLQFWQFWQYETFGLSKFPQANKMTPSCGSDLHSGSTTVLECLSMGGGRLILPILQKLIGYL